MKLSAFSIKVVTGDNMPLRRREWMSRSKELKLLARRMRGDEELYLRREGIEKRIIPDELGYFHVRDISQKILNYLREE